MKMYVDLTRESYDWICRCGRSAVVGTVDVGIGCCVECLPDLHQRILTYTEDGAAAYHNIFILSDFTMQIRKRVLVFLRVAFPEIIVKGKL